MSKQRTIAGRALRLAAVGGIALGALAPTAAYAAPSCYPNTCDVVPNTETKDPGDPADPQVEAKTATKAATLPFTGGDATGLAVIGVGAVAAGAIFVRQSRRKVNA
ncbi:MAG: hypothetical protein ABIP21_07380 [Acidimicrobiia bacterium]